MKQRAGTPKAAWGSYGNLGDCQPATTISKAVSLGAHGVFYPPPVKQEVQQLTDPDHRGKRVYWRDQSLHISARDFPSVGLAFRPAHPHQAPRCSISLPFKPHDRHCNGADPGPQALLTPGTPLEPVGAHTPCSPPPTFRSRALALERMVRACWPTANMIVAPEVK